MNSIIVLTYVTAYHSHVLMHVYQRCLVLNLKLIGNSKLLLKYFKGVLLSSMMIVNVLLVIVDVDNKLPPLRCRNLDGALKLSNKCIHSLDGIVNIDNVLVHNGLKLSHNVEVLLLRADLVLDIDAFMDGVHHLGLILQSVVRVGKTRVGLQHR